MSEQVTRNHTFNYIKRPKIVSVLTHTYNLIKNFSSRQMILPPKAKNQLTKPPTSGMKIFFEVVGQVWPRDSQNIQATVIAPP